MDIQGRLHIPKKNGEGFVGKTYEETGVLEEKADMPEGQENRHARRKARAKARKATCNKARTSEALD